MQKQQKIRFEERKTHTRIVKDLRVFITFYLTYHHHTSHPSNLFNFKSFLNQLAFAFMKYKNYCQNEYVIFVSYAFRNVMRKNANAMTWIYVECKMYSYQPTPAYVVRWHRLFYYYLLFLQSFFSPLAAFIFIWNLLFFFFRHKRCFCT